MEAVIFVIGAILVDNLLLSKLFGLESFFTASEKPANAALYGGIVTGVTVVSGTLILCLYNFVFLPLKITFLTTFTSVIVITAVICAVQIAASKISKVANVAVEAALPMVTGNCVVLGSVLLAIENELSFGMSVLFLFAAGVGFTLAMLIFSCVQKRLEVSATAESFRGIPILLISAALAAMAFSGFFGLSF